MHGQSDLPRLGGANRSADGRRFRPFGSGVSGSPIPDKYVGIPDSDGNTDIKKTEEYFEYLTGLLLNAPDNFDTEEKNRNIPAGYTYFGQFCAHDLTINAELAPDIRDSNNPANLRFRSLLLDTLYGLGPAIDRHCFRSPAVDAEINGRFRLSPVAGSRAAPGCVAAPRRDIGRTRLDDPDASDSQRSGYALIADARNDDNAVLSQLTAALKLAHNALMDKFAGLNAANPALQWAEFGIFSRARIALTHAYHVIVRNDFLSRLLDDEVYAHYNGLGSPADFLWIEPAGSPVSREFAHAVYRVGHSMVRENYVFGDFQTRPHSLQQVLLHTSQLGANVTPLNKNWIAAWSRFFDIPGNQEAGLKPQYSSRIYPFIPKELESTVKAIGGMGIVGRDLARQATSGISKVRDLADYLVRGIKNGHMSNVKAALGTLDFTTIPALDDWAKRPSATRLAMPPDFLKFLTSDPPLGIYVLIESFAFQGGEKLGPLGSLIVAETFFRALLDAEAILDEQAADIRSGAKASDIARLAFPNIPQSAPDLLVWIGSRLSQCETQLSGGGNLAFI